MTVFGARHPLSVARSRTAQALVNRLQYLRSLTSAILDPYRPELHYMRGPGPKWREKHAIN
jgi:hypothetical protein